MRRLPRFLIVGLILTVPSFTALAQPLKASELRCDPYAPSTRNLEDDPRRPWIVKADRFLKSIPQYELPRVKSDGSISIKRLPKMVPCVDLEERR